jgi:hypothetical protein
MTATENAIAALANAKPLPAAKAKAAKPAKPAKPAKAKAKAKPVSLTDMVRKLLADNKAHSNVSIAAHIARGTINAQKLCEAMADRGECRKTKGEGGRIAWQRVAAKRKTA